MGTPYAEAIRHWETSVWTPAPPLPEVNLPELAAQATRVFEGDQAFSGNLVITDNVLVRGSATITGAVTFRGLLVVEGDLMVTGNVIYTCSGPVGAVTLGNLQVRGNCRMSREAPGTAGASFPAVVSLRGNIELAGSAEVCGSVYAMGTGAGGLITLQGNIRLKGGAYGRRVISEGDVDLDRVWQTVWASA